MNIKDFLAKEQDQQAIVTELMNGRNKAVPEVAAFTKELNPLEHDVCDHIKRRDKWVKIDPEDVGLESSQNVTSVNGDGSTQSAKRIESVARIALAIQKLIVRRSVAFLFGNDVVLTADTEEGSKDEEVLKACRKVLSEAKTRTLNRKVARTIFSCTEAAELWYPVEKPHNKYGFNTQFKLRCLVLSPLNGDELYPYFDETGDLVAFSRRYYREDNNKIKHFYFETYTDEQHIVWKQDQDGWTLVDGYPRENVIKKIPVVYGCQEQVEWADVQNLIDRLEKLLSNFADTNDYHASPKIVVKGEILQWSKKGDSGSIIEMDNGGSADYLTWSQAPESVKLEIETLLRMIYTLTQTPDIAFDSVKGLNISGVALELMFMDAHLKVEDKREIFDEYLQRRMAIILAYLKLMNTRDAEFGKACDNLTIEVEVSPYTLKDQQSMVNLLMNATGQKAIMSRKTAVSQLGWVADPTKEIEQIELEESTTGMSDIFKQEPTE